MNPLIDLLIVRKVLENKKPIVKSTKMIYNKYNKDTQESLWFLSGMAFGMFLCLAIFMVINAM